MIEIKNIVSSSIGKVAYEPKLRELTVEFVKTGRVYMYSNVSKNEFKELINAVSIGSYIATEIVPVKEFVEVM